MAVTIKINPCPDSTVTVNDSAYGSAPSGGSLDVDVVDENDNPVGSLSGGKWVVETFAITSPLDIGGAQLWLDGQDETTFNAGSISDTDAVYEWRDKSANSYVFDQGTAASQPTYTANAINSKFGTIFDGVDDFLETSTGNAIRTGDAEGSYFFVGNFVNTSINLFISWSEDAAGSDFFLPLINTSGNLQISRRLSAVQDIIECTTTTLSNGTPFIATVVSNGTSYTLRLNGIDQSFTGTDNGNWIADFSIDKTTISSLYAGGGGSQFYYPSENGEAVYYNRALTAYEIQKVEQFLANKYGISI